MPLCFACAWIANILACGDPICRPITLPQHLAESLYGERVNRQLAILLEQRGQQRWCMCPLYFAVTRFSDNVHTGTRMGMLHSG